MDGETGGNERKTSGFSLVHRGYGAPPMQRVEFIDTLMRPGRVAPASYYYAAYFMAFAACVGYRPPDCPHRGRNPRDEIPIHADHMQPRSE